MLGCNWEGDVEPAKRVPHFLGHDMGWWAALARDRPGCYRDDGEDPADRLLDYLGIRDAVLAYVKDEDAWGGDGPRPGARRDAMAATVLGR